ncbi:MAG: GntR family transcriptional regulator [Propionibacteriaceae bacterium]|jgi:DNA-binding transcriptional regulator YhcF (GntR family)|nr:GntR family transcriptional regulator [Propionibacteriaceae bacterium]
MLLSIAPDSDTPIYLQLRHQIVDALVSGELREGDQLPSVRQLAVELGINLHTVNKAYKVLEDEGYLRIYGRRGARITSGPTYNDDYLQQLADGLERLFTDARSHGIDAGQLRQIVDETINKGA